MTKYRIKEVVIGNNSTYYPQYRNFLGFWCNFSYRYFDDIYETCSLNEAQKVIDDTILEDNKKVRYIKYP